MRISENLSLAAVKVKHSELEQKKVSTGTNFYYVVDVSGSMSSELPKLRLQLKNQLSLLLKPEDRISIVWFSCDNKAGILQESVQVTDLMQLENLKKAIDKYLVPQGCTAFRKPLAILKEIIERANSANPNCLIFLTDGYNNDCKMSDVMANLKMLETHITSTTFVEYGYYADSKTLSAMAETIGGEKISADSFEMFEPHFAKKLSTPLLSTKKTEVTLPSPSAFEFAFAVTEAKDINVFDANKSLLVSSDIDTVYYFTNELVNEPVNDDALYAAVHILADKLKMNECESVLAKLGDIRLFNQYSGSFGKQKLIQFKNDVKECVSDDSKRFINGKANDIQIDNNAFCLIDCIDMLQQCDAKFYPFDGNLKYNKITRAKNYSKAITDEQKELLAKVNTPEELIKLTEKIKEENKALEFKIADTKKGYSINDLVFNETRANLSIRMTADGTIDLPKNKFEISTINTFRWFTFNVVKDGIVNFDILPISTHKDFVFPLSAIEYVTEYFPDTDSDDKFYLIDIKKMPVINRKMFKELSAVELLKKSYQLEKLKAANKVFKPAEEYKANKSIGIAEKYGVDVAEYLKELGITDSGFSPKGTQADSTDSYVAVDLDVKIAGLSSLPKVEDTVKKINEGKNLTAGDMLLKPYIEERDSMYKLMESVKDYDDKAVSSFIVAKSKSIASEKSKLMAEIAQSKFALILSRSWFKEFKSIDENTLEIDIDGQKVKAKFELSEKVEKI